MINRTTGHFKNHLLVYNNFYSQLFIVDLSAKLQNTGPLIYISLNHKRAYCVILRSSRDFDTCFYMCSEVAQRELSYDHSLSLRKLRSCALRFHWLQSNKQYLLLYIELTNSFSIVVVIKTVLTGLS